MVLIDGWIYSTLENDFTKETGVEYALIPVYGNLFHSKIFLFMSKSKSRVLIGSHNLTLSGITQNLELSWNSDNSQLTADCLDYVYSILGKNLDSKNQWYQQIDAFRTNTTNSNLITNENQPILEQIITLVKKRVKKIEEVIIFSPYFSDVEIAVEKLLSLNPKSIKICVQKNNHNLEFHNRGKYSLVSLCELAPNHMRRLHSKFVIFRNSEKDLIMMGSPNFTSPALLKTSKGGNFEVALLLEEDHTKFLQNFTISSITKKELSDSKRRVQEKSNNIQYYPVIITFAYFDDFGRLNIEYISKSANNVSMILYSEQENTQIALTIEPGKQVISVNSVPRTTNLIYFSKDDKIISNRIRICSPKGMKVRTAFELEDSKSVQKALTEIVDLEDIANLCFSLFSPHDEKIGDYEVRGLGTKTPLPGKRTSSSANMGIIELLNRLFRLSAKQVSKDTNYDKTKQRHASEPKEINDLLSDLILKLTEKFEREISLKTSFTKRYSVYLVIALKLIKKLDTGKTRGISSVSVISGLNSMVANDASFTTLDFKEMLEILSLLIILVKETENNLNIPYKFDDEGILAKFRPLILKYLYSDDSVDALSKELIQSERYGFDNMSDIDQHIVTEIFMQELQRLPVTDCLEVCKKIIQQLDYENNYSKIELGYSKLRLFLSKNHTLRDRILSELKYLKNKQNIDAVKRIISELSK
jgi:HKD family nuclease